MPGISVGSFASPYPQPMPTWPLGPMPTLPTGSNVTPGGIPGTPPSDSFNTTSFLPNNPSIAPSLTSSPATINPATISALDPAMASTSFPAPNFTVRMQNGYPVTLHDILKQKPVILFFYPKEGSFFCSKQIAAMKESFKNQNVELIGISCLPADPKTPPKAPADPNAITLLQDPNQAIQTAYKIPRSVGDWMPNRVTYVIDPSTKLAKQVASTSGLLPASNDHIENAKAALSQLTPVRSTTAFPNPSVMPPMAALNALA